MELFLALLGLLANILFFVFVFKLLNRRAKRRENAFEKQTHDGLVELRSLKEPKASLPNNSKTLKHNVISASKVKKQTKINNPIFISYRREDSADVTGRIYDQLVNQFEEESVFKDVDNIPGVDFREYIDKYIVFSSVLLVVIGKNWVGQSHGSNKRRIDDPRDYTRLEVAGALKRKIAIIPILVSGAAMPEDDELSNDIRELAFRNAIQARSDPDFKHDMERLMKGLKKLQNIE